MPKHQTGRFLTRLRTLSGNDEGASQPFMILAAVLVFGIVSVTFGGGLHAAMNSMQQQKVNSALATRVNDIAMKEAARGYPVVSALPATTNITITVAGTAVPAQRIVAADSAKQTAKVTVRVGKYADGKWENPAACDAAPIKCVSASDIASPNLSQSVPQTAGLTTLPAASNIPANTEVAWMDVAAGLNTYVAIDSNGILWSWGKNQFGEAGQGNTSPVLTPKRVSVPSTKFVSVAAGDKAMYAIDADSRLWAWGDDTLGQLGNGTTGSVTVPTKMTGTLAWTEVSAGPGHACGVTAATGLYCWGNGAAAWRASTAVAQSPVQIFAAGEAASNTTTTRFTSVSVGLNHQVALDASGDVYTWGSATKGQLGNGSVAGTVNVPTRVNSSAITAMIMTVEASSYSTFVIDAYGRMYAWGANATGQLGDGTLTQRAAPARVGSNLLFSDVTASIFSTYAVARDGIVYAWGQGDGGALGVDDATVRTTPAVMTKAATFSTIATSRTSAAAGTSVWALDTTHRLWAWGTGTWGDGNGATTVRATAEQNRIRTAGGVTVNQVAAGTSHSIALGSDGTVWGWGSNGSGQLGNGTTTASTSPVQADATYADQPVAVAAGNGSIIVTGKLGQIVGSGANSNGELGVNIADRNTPAAAATGQYSQVAMGASHTVAINRSNGAVVAWGQNSFGQLGNGSTTNSKTPVAVRGLPAGASFVEVVAGDYFSAALDIDGNVYTWGRNDYGQIGDGSTQGRNNAVQVPISGKITTIGAGDQHMLAVSEDGQLWAWGRNDENQLGIAPADTRRAIPVAVNTPAPLVAVDGALNHSIGLTAAGDLVVWGDSTGTLNGTGSAATTPKTIAVSAKFSDIAAAVTQSFAVDTDGDLWVWGTDSPSGILGRGTVATPTELTTGRSIVSVDTSRNNTAYVTSTGVVAVTGVGTSGQFGRGSATDSTTFVDVPAWNTAVQANTPSYAKSGTAWTAPEFVDIDTNASTTAAIDARGHLWVWGAGDAGQTGAGKKGNLTRPALAATTTRYVDVAVAAKHVVALGADGSVWTFGASQNGANGRNVTLATPTRMPVADEIADIAASDSHTATLAEGGTFTYMWGTNTDGQLGAPAAAKITLPHIEAVPEIAGLAAGDGYTILWKPSSSVPVWGKAPWGDAANPMVGEYADMNATGQVVAGALRTSTNQIKIRGIDTDGSGVSAVATVSSSRFTNVDASTGHVIALDANGTVWTWGSNSSGQLGRTGTANKPTTVAVVGDPNRTVFAVQSTPVVATTLWKIGTVASNVGSVQVNVNAGMPLKSVVIVCADGTQKQMAPALASTGEFNYANITIESTAGCTTPTLAAVLDGAPATAGEVSVVVVPLVYVDETDGTW